VRFLVHDARQLIRLCVPFLVIGVAVLVFGLYAVRAPDQTAPGDRRSLTRAGCRPENFRIALDVGHTPEQPGAISARGTSELVFNLQLARRIQQELIDGGFHRTALITAHGSGSTQLARRTEQAKAAGTDLLLSIHHDDVKDSLHETWIYRGAPHAFSDRFSGYALFVSKNNRYFEDSLAFAKRLGAELTARGLHYTSHHARQLLDAATGVYRYDGLHVLRLSSSPAVLMEAGIIVNRNDELKLASAEERGHISAAVLAALNQFCAEKTAERTAKS
jgi:N-acetylmuramoyl-L-alanine amidase